MIGCWGTLTEDTVHEEALKSWLCLCNAVLGAEKSVTYLVVCLASFLQYLTECIKWVTRDMQITIKFFSFCQTSICAQSSQQNKLIGTVWDATADSVNCRKCWSLKKYIFSLLWIYLIKSSESMLCNVISRDTMFSFNTFQ